jgi:phosphonate transport system substrate-binding protein
MDRLRFGTYLAPNMLPVYQAITEEVGRRLGVETELVVETDYESCAQDKNEVCFVCSLVYLEFERQGISPAVPIAAPVLEGERYGDRPIYFSDVIVHRDSPFTSILDLRGRSWAYNEPLSHSGYGVTRYHLVELGETDGFFGSVIEAGFHEESIRMVAGREVDASAIDSQVLAVALRDDPSLARSLRVIDALGPSTIQPVAVSRRVPLDLRSRILEVLVTMHDDPTVRERLALGLVKRFVPVGASSYDDIRMMLEACEAAGFMQVR